MAAEAILTNCCLKGISVVGWSFNFVCLVITKCVSPRNRRCGRCEKWDRKKLSSPVNIYQSDDGSYMLKGTNRQSSSRGLCSTKEDEDAEEERSK